MTYTTNLHLKKPDGTDAVSIGDINDNADIIDGALPFRFGIDPVSGEYGYIANGAVVPFDTPQEESA